MNLVQIVIRASADQANAVIGDLKRRVGDLGSFTNRTITGWSSSLDKSFQGMSKSSGSWFSGFISSIGKAGHALINMGNNGVQGMLLVASAAVPVAAALAGLLGYLSEIIGALASVGLAVGAFGALAYPIFGKVTAGVSAVGKAVGDVAKDKAWAAIPKALQPAVHTILDIQSAWQKMSNSMLPIVGRISSTIADLVQKLLPLIEPLAKAGGRAIENFFKQLNQGAGSKNFKQFVDQMTALSGPSMKATANGILNVGSAIGQFLKDISGSGQGPGGITAIFTTLADAIRIVGAQLHSWQVLLRGEEILFGNLAHVGIIAAKAIGDAWLAANGVIDRAFSHLPIIGGLFKSMGNTVASWQKGFDNSMNHAIGTMKNWTTTVTNAPKVAKLDANIVGLQTKLAIARQNLNNPDLTKTRRAEIQANINNLITKIAQAKALLASLNGTSATTYVNTIYRAPGTPGSTGGYAHGGIVGAASGMIHSGLTLVGEQGPELVNIPSGATVHSSPDSMRMMAAMGAEKQKVVVEFDYRGAENEFLRWLRRAIVVRGGNVQTVLGRT